MTVMADVGFTVEIGFETAGTQHLDGGSGGVFDSVDTGGGSRSISFDDVTGYVQQVDIQRGRNDSLAQFSIGQCQLTLRDPDRRFDPTNASSPYYPHVRPGRLVRVTVEDSGATTRSLFSGYIDNKGRDPFTWSYDQHNAYVSIRCHDLRGYIRKDNVGPVTRGQFPGPVLEAAMWGGPYSFAQGQVRLAGTQGATVELTDVINTEQGALWCTADGVLTFDDRVADVLVYDTVALTLSDDGADTPYLNALDYTFTPTYGRWDVSGGEFTSTVTSSTVAEWFQASVSAPLCLDQTEADRIADWYLWQYELESWQPSAVALAPLATDAMLDAASQTDLRTRIEVEHTPFGGGSQVSHVVFVESINHSITPGDWRTTWGLSTADRYGWTDPDDWAVVGSAVVGTHEVAP